MENPSQFRPMLLSIGSGQALLWVPWLHIWVPVIGHYLCAECGRWR